MFIDRFTANPWELLQERDGFESVSLLKELLVSNNSNSINILLLRSGLCVQL